MQAKERLYLTKDGKGLVAEGDPKGASLYAAPGDEIPESAVKMFGLVDGGLKERRGGRVCRVSSGPEANGPRP